MTGIVDPYPGELVLHLARHGLLDLDEVLTEAAVIPRARFEVPILHLYRDCERRTASQRGPRAATRTDLRDAAGNTSSGTRACSSCWVRRPIDPGTNHLHPHRDTLRLFAFTYWVDQVCSHHVGRVHGRLRERGLHCLLTVLADTYTPAAGAAAKVTDLVEAQRARLIRWRPRLCDRLRFRSPFGRPGDPLVWMRITVPALNAGGTTYLDKAAIAALTALGAANHVELLDGPEPGQLLVHTQRRLTHDVVPSGFGDDFRPVLLSDGDYTTEQVRTALTLKPDLRLYDQDSQALLDAVAAATS